MTKALLSAHSDKGLEYGGTHSDKGLGYGVTNT